MNIKDTLYRIGHWKTWDWRLKYLPILPGWFWYCLRARAIWFFTPSNPTLSFGGFDGQGKMEMYRQLPKDTYPKTLPVPVHLHFGELLTLFAEAGFDYPVVVKPNVGKMGLMFRKIGNATELKRYHEWMPVDYLLQEFIAYPVEVSVFYVRFPEERRGRITGFIKKEYLAVVGDGKSTLAELIVASPPARFRQEELCQKHNEKLHWVLDKGEQYCLSPALNLSRGSKLVSLEHEIDERLQHVFDNLSDYSKSLFYGRYDIKCTSIEDLKAGKNFSILEFNGSGGEPHHVYATDDTLIGACTELLEHWNMLYKISRANHERGIRYWGFNQGLRFLMAARKHNKMLERLDREFPLG